MEIILKYLSEEPAASHLLKQLVDVLSRVNDLTLIALRLHICLFMLSQSHFMYVSLTVHCRKQEGEDDNVFNPLHTAKGLKLWRSQ